MYDVNTFRELNQPKKEILQNKLFIPPHLKKKDFLAGSVLLQRNG